MTGEAGPRSRLRHRLMLAFAGFALIVAVLYGFYVLLFVYVVEDRFIHGLLEDEARAQLAHRARHGAWARPRLDFMSVHETASTLPDALAARLVAEPWRREFPGSSARHYHVRALQPAGASQPAWLLAEVSGQLVVRQMRDKLLHWLGWTAIALVAAALGLGAWLARRLTAALSRLASVVDTATPSRLPAGFAAGFPDDEVGTLARGLERMIGRIDSFVAREREFTRDASHELRTPLAVIRSACERLSRCRELDGESLRQLEHVQQSARQLEATVVMLLTLAREDACEAATEIALMPLLERVIVDQAMLPGGRDVRVRLDVPAGTHARWPRTVLHVVLSNLVGNAFAHGRGEVVITVDGDMLCIANPGAWIGDAALRPFVKHAASGGVGLGLAIVQRLCERHGAALQFHVVDGATEVRIALRDATRVSDSPPPAG